MIEYSNRHLLERLARKYRDQVSIIKGDINIEDHWIDKVRSLLGLMDEPSDEMLAAGERAMPGENRLLEANEVWGRMVEALLK